MTDQCFLCRIPDPTTQRLHRERACVFVVPKAGQQLSFEQIVQFLSDQRVAPQYQLERLEVLAELPLTPSGKVQKFKLREMAKAV